MFVPSRENNECDEYTLGGLQCIPSSWNSKVNYASFNFCNKTVEIGYESIISQKTPITYVKNRFESFGTNLSKDAFNHISDLENGF